MGRAAVEGRQGRPFETVFAQHFGGLVRALTVICGDRETAADCVQEAFLRAHQRWERLDGYEDPVGWVRRVAINLAHDAHRRRRRGQEAQRRLALVEGDRTTETALPDPLLAELGQLPPRQRAALALRYVEGLSVAEIASALGISQGAVKFHLHAGRERLRPLIARGDA
jgi:RNA polymerase sigma-70 factor (ECF subfamily)